MDVSSGMNHMYKGAVDLDVYITYRRVEVIRLGG